MLDIEDFDAVFQKLSYSDGIVDKVLDNQHVLNGRTFFERLLDLLKIKAKKLYPPKTPQQLYELHQRIIAADTTLHNKHCLIFYLLKDLSQIHHEETELSTQFARDVHLEKRFWTFIEGLWSLDHLDFAIAVSNLTHPSIIPTFPDEILFTLLKTKERMGNRGVQSHGPDDILPLAYYNCAKPPLEDTKVRDEFAKYLAARNVNETYHWIHERPEHEHKPLLEILVERTLEKHLSLSEVEERLYPREQRALELVSLPLSEEEEEFLEKFLLEGKGRTLYGAQDTVMMRRVATGKLADMAGDTGIRGRRVDGVSWEMLKDGVKKGLGPRKDEGRFVV